MIPPGPFPRTSLTNPFPLSSSSFIEVKKVVSLGETESDQGLTTASGLAGGGIELS
jgi:hypothetical protein